MSELTECRICRSKRLLTVVDLGEQYLTGVFPAPQDPEPSRGPLRLVKCSGEGACGLVQLGSSYDPDELYGDTYGYRSSLNASMVEHLRGIAAELKGRVKLGPGDVVLDIGSNDGTLLSFFDAEGLSRVGVDPTAKKFAEFYPPDVHLIFELFPSAGLRDYLGGRRVKLLTSIAMLYDVEDPLQFFRSAADVLAEDGLWFFEQSYLPAMLRVNAYDTICHEHAEYYALEQISYLAERAGLRVLFVKETAANGGSFAVTVCKKNASYEGDPSAVASFLERERALGLDGAGPYEAFARRIATHREELLQLLRQEKAEGRRVLGYGASTKGNVVLQYCGITPDLLECIAEVNDYKFGRTTPGTRIPIVSEEDARAREPSAFLVFPWHFRENILGREAAFLEAGGRLIFPLPQIEVVSR